MAGNKNGRGIKLASYDSIFDSEESAREAQLEKVQMIPIDQIDPFPNHPYKVEVNEQMMEMAESIAQYGVLVPALIRPKEGGRYEMVAGHRRLKASELASQNEIPCIVRELSDDEAVILMVDSVRP